MSEECCQNRHAAGEGTSSYLKGVASTSPEEHADRFPSSVNPVRRFGRILQRPAAPSPAPDDSGPQGLVTTASASR